MGYLVPGRDGLGLWPDGRVVEKLRRRHHRPSPSPRQPGHDHSSKYGPVQAEKVTDKDLLLLGGVYACKTKVTVQGLSQHMEILKTTLRTKGHAVLASSSRYKRYY